MIVIRDKIMKKNPGINSREIVNEQLAMARMDSRVSDTESITTDQVFLDEDDDILILTTADISTL